MRRDQIGLRGRSTLAFALGALGVSLALVAITYGLAQTYLLRQRESLAARAAYLDARVVRDILQSGSTDIGEVLDGLAGQSGADIAVRVSDKWYSSSLSLGETTIPDSVRGVVSTGAVGRQRTAIEGVPTLVIGVPLLAANAEFYEAAPLRELDRTLTTLLVILLVAASFTTIVGAGAGYLASRRVLRPLREVSAASAGIAGGALETRLESRPDPDLSLLVRSFNDMAGSLQHRIEREARFASDVSHELRTPLTVMTNAMQIVRTRAADLPDRTRAALEIFFSQVEYFERLVLDLLEISRLDAQVDALDPREVELVPLIRSTLVRTGSSAAIVASSEAADCTVPLDERRFVQILTNLVDNAERYAGGVVTVVVAVDSSKVLVHVDDDGPGIPEAERATIFERFHRGQSARSSSARRGAGLGLAIARQHACDHGGDLHVSDAPSGGARFTIELPRRQP